MSKSINFWYILNIESKTGFQTTPLESTNFMTKEIHQHLTTNYYLSKKQIMVNNFIGGLCWGLGTVIGATIVVAILFSTLEFFNFVPGIDQLLNSPQVKGIQTNQK
jgi:hypothetical protein